MAINDETRIVKTNTLEEFRQKTNDVSFDVGDNKLISSNIGDKTKSFTAAASQTLFEHSTMRFEFKPEETIDNTSHSESLPVGRVRVYNGAQELTQKLSGSNTFRVPNYVANITLTGSPTLTEFNHENVEVYQVSTGGAQTDLSHANVSYRAKVISASVADGIRVKSESGTYNASRQFRVHPGTSGRSTSTDTITSAQHTARTVIDSTYGRLIQLNTAASANDAIKVVSHSLVDAINELQDDVGITENLTTSASNLVGAVNEIEAVFDASTHEISAGTNAFDVASGNFTLDSSGSIVLDADTGLIYLRDGGAEFGQIVNNSGEVQFKSGSGSAVFLSASGLNATFNNNLVIEGTADVDGNFEVGASKFNVIAASGNTQIDGTLDVDGLVVFDTNATVGGNLIVNGTTADINANLDVDGTGAFTGAVGIDGNFDINTNKFTVAASSGNTVIAGTLSIGTLNTAANDVRAAINEHEADIGTVGNLTTSATSLVTAINELDLKQGAANLTTSANTLSGAVNELKSAKVDLTSSSSQTINSNIGFTSGKTFTFPSGSTLEIASGAALTIAGSATGVSTFGVDFLEVDGNQASTGMGLKVNREHISGAPTPGPAIQWREGLVASKADRAWELVGLDTTGSNSTAASIVTFFNAKHLFANNDETGVAVTWDQSNQNFDIELTQDSTITLTGDVTGTGTMTNLGNVSFATDLVTDHWTVTDGSNSTDVTLGQTLTIQGTANEVEVNENSRTVTVGLPNNVVIANNLNVNGNTTLGNQSSDTVSVPGNMTITGDLTVNGTNTILNTSTIEVEDTLVLAGNNLTAEPATGGFGIEAGPQITQTVNGATSSSTSVVLDSVTGVVVGNGVYGTGAGSNATVTAINTSSKTLTLSVASSFADGATLTFSHPTKASNVTGAHSIVYNYATDRWEADGSLILSNATNTPPTIESNNFGAGTNLDFVNGTGITAVTSTSGSDIDVTITNTDRGSSQLFYKTFTADSGSNAVASANNDTIDIEGGTLISTVGSADKITLNHDNVSRSNTNATDDGTYVKGITTNAQGHITAVDSGDFDDYYHQRTDFASANTASAPVIRDGSGNFAAGTITANLTGNVTGNVTGTVSGNAGSASVVYVNTTSGNTDHRLIYGEGNDGSNGNETLYKDNTGGATYNPSTGRLTAASFGGSGAALTSLDAGNISSGTISDSRLPGEISSNISGTAAEATKIRVNATSASGDYRLIFRDGGNTTINNADIYSDAGGDAHYNPNTNTLTATNFAGKASTATKWHNARTVSFNHTDTDVSGSFSIDGNANVSNVNLQIEAGHVGTTELGSNAVTTAKIADDNVTFAKVENIATGTILGRNDSGTGNIEELSTSDVNTMLGSITSLSGSTGIDVSGSGTSRTLTIDLSELTDMTADVVGSQDELILLDNGADRRKKVDEIKLSQFNNDLGITSANNSTITIAAGRGLDTGGNFTTNASSGKTITLDLETDLRDSISHVGLSANTYMSFNSNSIDLVIDGGHEFRLESDGDGHFEGDVIAFSTTVSDERLKDNIQVVDGALEKVSQLRGVTFDWKKDGNQSAGLIAQELEQVLPSAVKEKELPLRTDDGKEYKTVEYSQVTALLVEAIKELREENIKIKSELEDLKNINS